MAVRGTVIPTAPKLPFHNVEAPQPPTGTAGFSNVNGVVLLKNGNVVVNQRLSMFQTLEYDSQNRLIRNVNPNMISRPHGFRIDAQDNLWITDQQCGIVVKMSPTGQVLMTLGTKGKSGTWNEAKGERFLNQPTDLAFAPNGDIYVSTGHGPNEAARVTRFDKTGKYITSWSMAHADGSQAVIHTIAIRPTNGEVWVADREQKKLKVFDAMGKPLREIQMQNLPCGLYVDPKGQLWLTTGMDGMILRLDWDGKILGYLGQSGFGKDDFGEAHYMTMSPDGKTIYVGDTVNNDIKKFVAN
jgi:sugar lactone lactonase YvrE